MKLPKYSERSQTAEAGITIIKSIIEDWHWLFRRNNQQDDFGIDAYLDVITPKGEITGKSIAIQLKTGQSYFSEKNEIGWIYRGKMSHLNYYLNHDIPVVLILVDEKKTKAYWTIIEADKTSLAGTSWKITVPFSQELNSDSRDDLEKFIGPALDYASQLENYWLFNKRLIDSDRILLLIDRKEVEACEFTELKQAFERLAVNTELLIALRDKVDLLIDGYNDDPRELEEIEEVRHWMGLVISETRGLSYFLPKDDFAQFLKLLQFCMMSHRRIEHESKSKKIIEFKHGNLAAEQFKELYTLLIDDLNQFSEVYNIPENINYDLTSLITNFLAPTGFKPLPMWSELSDEEQEKIMRWR